MHILLNGADQDIPEAMTIQELLAHFGYEPKAIAIAVNREFISRAMYPSVTLKEDDEVEIVAPMQGG